MRFRWSCCAERQPEEWPTTVDVVRLEMRKTPVSFLAGLVRARRFLRDFQPDLIHSHVFPANMAARLLDLSTRRRFSPPFITSMKAPGRACWPTG